MLWIHCVCFTDSTKREIPVTTTTKSIKTIVQLSKMDCSKQMIFTCMLILFFMLYIANITFWHDSITQISFLPWRKKFIDWPNINSVHTTTLMIKFYFYFLFMILDNGWQTEISFPAKLFIALIHFIAWCHSFLLCFCQTITVTSRSCICKNSGKAVKRTDTKTTATSIGVTNALYCELPHTRSNIG